jgi:hypothetical protein
MKINNVGEFYNFVINNGLATLSPELSSLQMCMSEYGRLCNCNNSQTKNAKLQQCKLHYINFIKNVNSHRHVLLSKTTDSSIIFCNDGQQLDVLHR